MHILVIILLVLAAHFSLTPFAPAPAGKGTFYWPFAADSQPLLSFAGGLPQQSGSILVPALAGIAGLSFIAAALALLGWVVPANWWRPLVVVAAIASILLYGAYFGLNSLLPIALDLLLLWGVLAQHWTVPGLHGV